MGKQGAGDGRKKIGLSERQKRIHLLLPRVRETPGREPHRAASDKFVVMPSRRDKPSSDPFAPVLRRNIAALLARRRAEEQRRTLDERIAAAVAAFTGSMISVYVHLVLFGSWIVINLGWTPLPPFDKSFVILAMIASVEAIFLSTFVLITQNRLSAEAERRADLDLQISLLAEHEITRLVQLVSEIGKRVGVEASNDPSLEPLKRDVAPEDVLDRLDSAERDQ